MNWVNKVFEQFQVFGHSKHQVKELPGQGAGFDTNGSREPSIPLFEGTIARVAAALREIRTREKLSILLFTSAPEYFNTSDLFDPHQGAVKSVRFADSEAALEACKDRFDVAVVCTHIRQEHKAQFIIRQKRLARLIVVWCWDNHHSFDANLRYNSLADLVLAGHSYCSDSLKTPHSVLGRSFCLPTSQWSRSLVSSLIVETLDLRSDALSGGHTLYDGAARNEILLALKHRVPGNALLLMDGKNREPYFSLSAEARFRVWAKYKVSIAVPALHDLSMRVFDALIVGQIPIVPTSCYDLDAAIPPHIQEILPVIRIGELSPETVEAAWRVAIERFDQGGVKGVVARHEYARDHHHISSRINGIAEYIKQLSMKKTCVVMNDSGIGLVAGVPQPNFPPPSAISLEGVIDLSAVYTDEVWPGAETARHGSTTRVITDSASWSYAAQAPLRFVDDFASGGWYWVDVSVEVQSGQVGVAILKLDGRLVGERLVSKENSRTRFTLPFLRGDVALLIRNGSSPERSVVNLVDARVYGMPIPEDAYP